MNGLVVFIGGGFGALVRYLLCLFLPKISYFSLGTLVANFFGCFFATVVFVYFVDKINPDSVYKTFLITGFCGGLSTLSALSLELMEMLQHGECLRAFAYAIITVVICTLSVLLGLVLVKHSIGIKL